MKRHQQREGAYSNQQRREMDVVDLGDEGPQLIEHRTPLHGHSAHLPEPTDDYQDCDPGHVADEHRVGEQIG